MWILSILTFSEERKTKAERRMWSLKTLHYSKQPTESCTFTFVVVLLPNFQHFSVSACSNVICYPQTKTKGPQKYLINNLFGNLLTYRKSKNLLKMLLDINTCLYFLVSGFSVHVLAWKLHWLGIITEVMPLFVTGACLSSLWPP